MWTSSLATSKAFGSVDLGSSSRSWSRCSLAMVLGNSTSNWIQKLPLAMTFLQQGMPRRLRVLRELGAMVSPLKEEAWTIRPSRCLNQKVIPERASSRFIFFFMKRSAPLRVMQGWGLMNTRTQRSAAIMPGSSSLSPVKMQSFSCGQPCSIATSSSFSCSTIILPLQALQTSLGSMMKPWALQAGQGPREEVYMPGPICTTRSMYRPPLHVPQSLRPFPPFPSQASQSLTRGCLTFLVHPSQTYSRVTSSFTSLGLPFCGPLGLLPPPLNMSKRDLPPRGLPPASTPSLPHLSQRSFFSGLPSTSQASLIFLNFQALPPGLSGWYFMASFRKAFLTQSMVAVCSISSSLQYVWLSTSPPPFSSDSQSMPSAPMPPMPPMPKKPPGKPPLNMLNNQISRIPLLHQTIIICLIMSETKFQHMGGTRVMGRIPREEITPILTEINSISQEHDPTGVPTSHYLAAVLPQNEYNASTHSLLMAGLFLLKYPRMKRILSFFSSRSVTLKVLEQLQFVWADKGEDLSHLTNCVLLLARGILELQPLEGPRQVQIPKNIILPDENTVSLRCLERGMFLTLPMALFQELNRQIDDQTNRENTQLIARVLGLSLGASTLSRIVKRFVHRGLNRNEPLFHENEPERNAYLLQQGSISLSANHQRKLIIEAENFLAESLNQGVHQFTGVCQTKCHVLVVEKKELNKLILEIPLLKEAMEALLHRRNRILPPPDPTPRTIEAQDRHILRCKTARTIGQKSLQSSTIIRSKPLDDQDEMAVDEKLYKELVGGHWIIKEFMESKKIVYDIMTHNFSAQNKTPQKFVSLKTQSREKKVEKYNDYLAFKSASKRIRGTGVRLGAKEALIKIKLFNIFDDKVSSEQGYIVVHEQKDQIIHSQSSKRASSSKRLMTRKRTAETVTQVSDAEFKAPQPASPLEIKKLHRVKSSKHHVFRPAAN